LGYSTVDMVKDRLGVSDASYDAFVGNCIVTADREIDIELSEYVTVPLSSPPDQIVEISADIAAAEFKL